MTQPTLAEIRQWPAAVTLPLACSAFGISRSHGYELAARGEFPARVIRVGARVVVVTADIVRSLSAADGGLMPPDQRVGRARPAAFLLRPPGIRL
jgi:predicted DNA-binding transcriptional regulator AlpA